MQFRNSSSDISSILQQIFTRTFCQLDRRSLLSFFHKYQAVLTVRRQLLLLKHSNPRHDTHQSRFRILNLWRDDQQPIPLATDSLNPFSIPSLQPQILKTSPEDFSVAASQLSILNDIKRQKKTREKTIQQHSKATHFLPTSLKATKQSQKTNRTWRRGDSKKHLIPLTKTLEDEPEEITVLREIKHQEGLSKERVSTFATTNLQGQHNRNYVRLDSSRGRSKERSKEKKKRPQTSNVYQMRDNKEKMQVARVMTATIRK